MLTLQILASRLFYLLVALAAQAVVPTFDASADDTYSFTTRWDVLHYKSIADNGYRWEHQYAFFPAMPILLRYLSPFILILLNLVLAYDSTMTLYKLSLHHLGRQDLSRLVALLSLLPSSPMTLYSAPEPFFAYLSYRGMLCCTKRQWFGATFFFTLASTFRSNGFFLAGFVIWGILFPYFERKQFPSLPDLSTAIISSALILSPFIAHNTSAYFDFCLSSAPPRWCSASVPLIYNHVQSRYWNVGLFRYWSLSQLPNFIIAFPPLLALFYYSIQYLWHFIGFGNATGPFFNSSIAPHAIHALFMSSILLFASHTQIVLRLAPSMPFTYWAGAYILTHLKDRGHTFVARAWILWALIWSVISVVLWVAFLPPA